MAASEPPVAWVARESSRLATGAHRTRLTLPKVRLLDIPEVAHSHGISDLSACSDVPNRSRSTWFMFLDRIGLQCQPPCGECRHRRTVRSSCSASTGVRRGTLSATCSATPCFGRVVRASRGPKTHPARSWAWSRTSEGADHPIYSSRTQTDARSSAYTRSQPSLSLSHSASS